MQTPVIIDLIAAAVLIGFTYFGAAKGLVRALAGLAAAVVSLAGANLIATALTGQAMKLAAPVIEQQIEMRLDEAIHDAFPGRMPGNPLDELDLPVEELLDLLGLDAQVRDSLTGGMRACPPLPPWWRVWRIPFCTAFCISCRSWPCGSDSSS